MECFFHLVLLNLYCVLLKMNSISEQWQILGGVPPYFCRDRGMLPPYFCGDRVPDCVLAPRGSHFSSQNMFAPPLKIPGSAPAKAYDMSVTHCKEIMAVNVQVYILTLPDIIIYRPMLLQSKPFDIDISYDRHTDRQTSLVNPWHRWAGKGNFLCWYNFCAFCNYRAI